MEHNEILTEMGMNYEMLVGYLKEKYGAAKCDYFTNATCNTRSKRITRTKEEPRINVIFGIPLFTYHKLFRKVPVK